MGYSEALAERVREYLASYRGLRIEEKRMFGGLAFLVADKMCVNVSGENLMCRFDPARTEEFAKNPAFKAMFMRGREYKGYCYIEPFGCQTDEDLKYWIDLCLDFNERAKSSKK
jgi:TfoX/Sxy family transcriptional regulator of competence genes